MTGDLYPVPRYSVLALQMLRVLAAGGAVPGDEMTEWIRGYVMFEELVDRFAREPFEVDVSLYDGAERELILHTFQRLLDADAVEAVRGEGLAMCAAFCVEVLQNPDGYAEVN